MKKILNIFFIICIFISIGGCTEIQNIEFDNIKYEIVNDTTAIQRIDIDEEICKNLANLIRRSCASGVAYEPVTLTDINSKAPFTQLKKVEIDNNEYYYNLFIYDNTDIIIVYKPNSNSIILDCTLVCEKPINYSTIMDNSDINNTLKELDNDIFSIDNSPIAQIKQCSAYFLDIDKNENVIWESIHISDEGFLWVGYNNNKEVAELSLIDNQKYVAIYNSYTKFE